MSSLPDWCEIPIDMNQAALVLGVSKRKLIDALKVAEVKAGLHFELRGTKKVFYRENILALRKVMTQCASKSQQGSAKAATTMLTATTLKAKESDTLLRLRTLAAQKS
jgi:hypothetical protein